MRHTVTRRRVEFLAFLSLICAAWVIGPLAFQPAPLVPAIQQTIQDLKIQALDAQQKGDHTKERTLYLQILRLNPDDATARAALDKLEAEQKRQTAQEVEKRIALDDVRAKEALVSAALVKAGTALADAKRLRSAQPLDRADEYLAEARKAAGGRTSPEIDRLARLVQLERGRIDSRWWQLIVGAAVAMAAGVAALIVALWRRKAVLEFVEGPEAGKVFVLKKPTTALGALASDVDCVIADPQRRISRRHCDVLKSGRHYFIVDRSTNGTSLNGRPLTHGEPTLLRRGDQVGLGDEIILKFR